MVQALTWLSEYCQPINKPILYGTCTTFRVGFLLKKQFTKVNKKGKRHDTKRN